MDELISEKELAVRINIPLSRLVRLRRFYDAPAHKIKNSFYYDIDEFLKYYEDAMFI